MTTIEQGLDAVRRILDAGEWNPECEVVIAALLDAQREIRVRDEAMKWLILYYRPLGTDEAVKSLIAYAMKEVIEDLDAARKKVDDD